jgi:hypothetical protein
VNLIEELEKLAESFLEAKERLEDALADKDWELVSEALYIISGARIDPPQEDDVLAQLMKRLDNLESGTPKSKPEKRQKVPYIPKVPKTPEVTNPSSRGRKGKIHNGKPNKFEEMTDLLSEVEKEPGYDAIKESKTRVKRRPPYKPAKVKCSKCHETFEVSPKLVKENFVCDDCIGK